MGRWRPASRLSLSNRGIPEIIDHRVNGLLFEPGDSDQLADMINMIWNDKTLAINLGLAGKEKVVNEYSGEKHYEKLFCLYKQVLGKRYDLNQEISSPERAVISKIFVENTKG
jgi:hypothetical protein